MYPSVETLAAAEPEGIEEIVRPCGLGKSKARDISACMRMLRDEYNSRVPDDFNELLKLPGVGRKSANLIIGRCVRKTGDCDGYALYPAVQPDRAGRRDQRSQESGDGALENYSA